MGFCDNSRGSETGSVGSSGSRFAHDCSKADKAIAANIFFIGSLFMGKSIGRAANSAAD